MRESTKGDREFCRTRGFAPSIEISPDLARCEWGMRTVHEILPIFPFSKLKTFQALEKLKRDFGYESKDCKVFNYWVDDPPVYVNATNVKWLLLARPADRTLLLVLQSWNKDDANVAITIDPDKLGFAPATKAWDTESNEQLSMRANQFNLTLPRPFGTRVIKIANNP